MSKATEPSAEAKDDMRPECDFSGAVQGATARRYAQGANVVVAAELTSKGDLTEALGGIGHSSTATATVRGPTKICRAPPRATRSELGGGAARPGHQPRRVLRGRNVPGSPPPATRARACKVADTLTGCARMQVARGRKPARADCGNERWRRPEMPPQRACRSVVLGRWPVAKTSGVRKVWTPKKRLRWRWCSTMPPCRGWHQSSGICQHGLRSSRRRASKQLTRQKRFCAERWSVWRYAPANSSRLSLRGRSSATSGRGTT